MTEIRATNQEFLKELGTRVKNKEISKEELVDSLGIKDDLIKTMQSLTKELKELKKLLAEKEKEIEIWNNINSTSFVFEKNSFLVQSKKTQNKK